MFWQLDESEDQYRRRQKLKRNADGSSHAGAAQNMQDRQAGIDMSRSRRSTSTASTTSNSTMDSSISGHGRSNRSESLVGTLGNNLGWSPLKKKRITAMLVADRTDATSLWKDLNKYQKKSDMVADEDPANFVASQVPDWVRLLDTSVKDSVVRVTTDLMQRYGWRPPPPAPDGSVEGGETGGNGRALPGGGGRPLPPQAAASIAAELSLKFRVTETEARQVITWVDATGYLASQAGRDRDGVSADGLGDSGRKNSDGSDGTPESLVYGEGTPSMMLLDEVDTMEEVADLLLAQRTEEDGDDSGDGYGLAVRGRKGKAGAAFGGSAAIDASLVSVFSCDVELLIRSPLVVCPGLLEVTPRRISFTRHETDPDEPFDEVSSVAISENSNSAAVDNSDYGWAMQPVDAANWETRDVVTVAYRHYQLRPVAIEIFFSDHTVIMLNMFTTANCDALHKAIVHHCRPPYLVDQPVRPIAVLKEESVHGIGLTEAWVQREITNFEYLMRLNTIAGRSYNDLAQYPVFPWVLSDYESENLDLTSPTVFRDLRLPMGIQNRAQCEARSELYHELASTWNPDDEMSELPFHYGSMYSNPAFVLWYLLRLEPYASLHIHLNDGRFDKPDRLFDSMAKTYEGCTSNPTDVKELVPEFFYLSDFLTNSNAFDMGTCQSGAKIGPVQLPPWAKGDVHTFVRLHRQALESEFVSMHLHHWIDLIFGYKQRPPHLSNGSQEAVKACNVYRPHHYLDAFDLETLEKENPSLYRLYVSTANEYGQVPVQLFPKRPHPQRIPLHQADSIWPIASALPGAGTVLKSQPEPQKPKFLLSYESVAVSSVPVVRRFTSASPPVRYHETSP